MFYFHISVINMEVLFMETAVIYISFSMLGSITADLQFFVRGFLFGPEEKSDCVSLLMQ